MNCLHCVLYLPPIGYNRLIDVITEIGEFLNSITLYIIVKIDLSFFAALYIVA